METKNEMDSRSSTFCINQHPCNGCMECAGVLVMKVKGKAVWAENGSDMINVGSERFAEYHEFVEYIRSNGICRENAISECG